MDCKSEEQPGDTHLERSVLLDHFVALDSWRGIAAIMVAIYHFHANSSISHSYLIGNGRLFVDFFFILSGFVIAANYLERLRAGFGISRFVLLRIGRLWPLHVSMLLLVFAIQFAIYFLGLSQRDIFSGQFSLQSFVSSLFLVQSMGIAPYAGNSVAWSISTEFWTYLIFAFTIMLMRFRPYWGMAFVGALAVLFLSFVAQLPEQFHVWAALARCVLGFSAGVLVYGLYKHAAPVLAGLSGAPKLFSLFEALSIVLLIGFLSLYDPTLTSIRYLDHVNMWPVPFFALVVFVFAFDRGVISRLLHLRPLVLIGFLSYSIYMTHTILQLWFLTPLAQIAEKLTGAHLLQYRILENGVHLKIWGLEPWQGNLATIFMLACIIFVSFWTYRLIEDPGRRFVRKVTSARFG